MINNIGSVLMFPLPLICVQVWVKPPEVLARDRLLGSYKASADQDKPHFIRLF